MTSEEDNQEEEVRKWRSKEMAHSLPDEKHRHGATTTTAMSHIAIQEALAGKVVEWMEKVRDEQYQAGLEA